MYILKLLNVIRDNKKNQQDTRSLSTPFSLVTYLIRLCLWESSLSLTRASRRLYLYKFQRLFDSDYLDNLPAVY